MEKKDISYAKNNQDASKRPVYVCETMCIMLRKLVIKADKYKTKLAAEDIAYMFPGKSIAILESCLSDLEHKQ